MTADGADGRRWEPQTTPPQTTNDLSSFAGGLGLLLARPHHLSCDDIGEVVDRSLS